MKIFSYIRITIIAILSCLATYSVWCKGYPSSIFLPVFLLIIISDNNIIPWNGFYEKKKE
jgi:hypothetical protein